MKKDELYEIIENFFNGLKLTIQDEESSEMVCEILHINKSGKLKFDITYSFDNLSMTYTYDILIESNKVKNIIVSMSDTNDPDYIKASEKVMKSLGIESIHEEDEFTHQSLIEQYLNDNIIRLMEIIENY